MVPTNDGNKPRTDLPLTEWIHLESFDTAQECENRKINLPMSIRPFSEMKDEDKDTARRILQSYLLARCIPSDSIQLK